LNKEFLNEYAKLKEIKDILITLDFGKISNGLKEVLSSIISKKNIFKDQEEAKKVINLLSIFIKNLDNVRDEKDIEVYKYLAIETKKGAELHIKWVLELLEKT
jgi:hypothetical protein